MKIPLILSLFVLGLVGCTRQDSVPVVTVAGAGSYRMEGRVVSCQASATSGSIISSGIAGVDSAESISVNLTATSEHARDTPPYLSLDFQRPAGQPNAPYQLELAMYLDGDYTTPPVFFDNVVATLRETSPGVVSGTFTDTKPGQSTVSEGSFTNVRVHPPTYPK